MLVAVAGPDVSGCGFMASGGAVCHSSFCTFVSLVISACAVVGVGEGVPVVPVVPVAPVVAAASLLIRCTEANNCCSNCGRFSKGIPFILLLWFDTPIVAGSCPSSCCSSGGGGMRVSPQMVHMIG